MIVSSTDILISAVLRSVPYENVTRGRHSDSRIHTPPLQEGRVNTKPWLDNVAYVGLSMGNVFLSPPEKAG